MSRIGTKPVEIPSGVSVSISGRTVTIKGPKGTLSMEHVPMVMVTHDQSEKAVLVTVDDANKNNRQARAMWGTTRALLNNMIVGVTNGYSQGMEIHGVGYTAEVQGNKLRMMLGFANPIFMDIPAGLEVTAKAQFVSIAGIDKQLVGSFAAAMKQKRKPEPYNGKGVRYQGEQIRRKQGKTFGN